VGVGEVRDVDVVADRRPVGVGVVGAVDLDVGAPPQRGRDHERDQVGLRVVVLASPVPRPGRAPAALKSAGRPSEP
jgi:hypothetical protein